MGFRIEIEKRLLDLAEACGLDVRPRRFSLHRTLGKLREREIIPVNVYGGLKELIEFGNRAAHGVDVSQDAADYVLEAGPEILTILDELIVDNTSDSDTKDG